MGFVYTATTFSCTNPDGSSYSVVYSSDRVDQEVNSIYQGLFDYFKSSPGGDGDTEGDMRDAHSPS